MNLTAEKFEVMYSRLAVQEAENALAAQQRQAYDALVACGTPRLDAIHEARRLG